MTRLLNSLVDTLVTSTANPFNSGLITLEATQTGDTQQLSAGQTVVRGATGAASAQCVTAEKDTPLGLSPNGSILIARSSPLATAPWTPAL